MNLINDVKSTNALAITLNKADYLDCTKGEYCNHRGAYLMYTNPEIVIEFENIVAGKEIAYMYSFTGDTQFNSEHCEVAFKHYSEELHIAEVWLTC